MKKYDPHPSFYSTGLILTLNAETGAMEANIPHTITLHSINGEGFGWGYGHRGAADLALNCLYQIHPERSKAPHQRVDGERVSDEILALYQSFKRDFLESLHKYPPASGHIIKIETMRKWLEIHRAKLNGRAHR